MSPCDLPTAIDVDCLRHALETLRSPSLKPPGSCLEQLVQVELLLRDLDLPPSRHQRTFAVQHLLISLIIPAI
jgi:hypothetical protein